MAHKVYREVPNREMSMDNALSDYLLSVPRCNCLSSGLYSVCPISTVYTAGTLPTGGAGTTRHYAQPVEIHASVDRRIGFVSCTRDGSRGIEYTLIQTGSEISQAYVMSGRSISAHTAPSLTFLLKVLRGIPTAKQMLLVQQTAVKYQFIGPLRKRTENVTLEIQRRVRHATLVNLAVRHRGSEDSLFTRP